MKFPKKKFKVKIEDYLDFGPNEMEDIMRMTKQKAFQKAEKKKKDKSKRAIVPDHPGSSLCTERSLSDLRARFDLGEDVALRLPSPDEHADNPLRVLYLVRGVLLPLFFVAPGPKVGSGVCDVVPNRPFPHYDAIPETSARDFGTELQNGDRHHARSPKKPPRDPTGSQIHGGSVLHFSCQGQQIIDGYPSKDEPYTNHFFFVALEDAVHDDLLGTVLTRWGTLGSCS